jgi:phage shock protein PspC (stress-responsive transcriptional regulator)
MSDEVKRLYRSRDERMLGGVCGGLAKYLNIEPFS